MQGSEMRFAAETLDSLQVFPVVRIINKCAEVYLEAHREMRKQMVGADLVALVWRVGNPMHQQEKMFQRITPDF